MSPFNPQADALVYVADGWPIFPVVPKGKKPLTGNGFLDATMDTDKVREWWRKWPDANIGIPCGDQSFDVLDIDGPSGEASLKALEDEHGKLETGLQVQTGRGRHILFTGGSLGKISAGKLGPGLDVRTTGSYVVAAGSLHENGNLYLWLDDGEDIPDPPEWLVRLCTEGTGSNGTSRAANNGEKPAETPQGQPIPEGGRNHHLASLAGTMRRKGSDISTIQIALHSENQSRCHPPLDDSEVSQIARSVGRYPPAEGGENGLSASLGTQIEGDDETPHGYSEHSLALQFTELHGKGLRYTSAWGQWHGWNSQRWKVDDTLRVPDLVRSVCKQVVNNPKVTPGQVNRICSAKTVTGIIALARTDRQHAATVDQWDADGWLLNCPGLTVNLKTGETWPNRQEDYQTKMTSVAPGGDCSLWLEFLQTVTGGDDDLISYLKRLSGYCLTGNVQEHSFHFLWGSGRNGKTTFTGALMGIMDSYARPAPVEAFMEGKHREHPTAIAGLQGVRLAVAPETGQGVRWNESLLSRLTGGETLTARHMREDYFDFEPTHKLLVVGNHRPRIRGINEAMKSRLHLIPFNVTIPREKRDLKLPEKLKLEWPGILSWMIDGCFEWINSGLRPPPVVVEATEEYFSNEDTVGKWIEDCCWIKEWCKGPISKLYESWKDWATRNNEYDPGKRAFGDSLEQRGHSRGRETVNRFHTGIDLKP